MDQTHTLQVQLLPSLVPIQPLTPVSKVQAAPFTTSNRVASINSLVQHLLPEVNLVDQLAQPEATTTLLLNKIARIHRIHQTQAPAQAVKHHLLSNLNHLRRNHNQVVRTQALVALLHLAEIVTANTNNAFKHGFQAAETLIVRLNLRHANSNH